MRFTIYVMLILLPGTAIAKDNDRTATNVSHKDTAAINVLLDQAVKIRNSNRDSGIYYTDIAYKAAHEIKYKKGIALASQLFGVVEMTSGNFSRALGYYKESISNYRALKDQKGIAKTYMLAGINEGMQNNSSNALKWFLSSMKIYESLKDEAGMAELYYKIGLVYGQVSDFDKALEYQHLSLKHAMQNNNTRLLMGLQTNIGMIYGMKKDYPRALEALQTARRLSIELQDETNTAHVFHNLGNVYRETGVYDSAAIYLNDARKIYEGAGYAVGLAGTYNSLADLKLQLHQYDAALEYLNKAVPLANQIGDQDLLYQDLIIRHAALAGKGDYRYAAILFDTIMRLGEEVDNAERAALLVRTKLNDEIEEKEASIKTLQAENEYKTRQRNILFIVAGISASFIFYIAYSLVQIRKKNRQLNAQKKELEELNQVKDKLFSVISHDLRGPFTRIMGIMDLIDMGAITDEERKELVPHLQVSAAATLETLDNLLVWGTSQLRKEPAKPVDVNMNQIAANTIQLYSNMADHKSVKLVNMVDDNCLVRFDKNHLEFVARNLVANAIKFSFEGQEVTLRSRRENGRVIFDVTDKGTGMSETARKALFNPAAREIVKGTAGESGVGLGLTLIMDFLRQNNGGISVESAEGKGSRFSINVPAAQNQ